MAATISAWAAITGVIALVFGVGVLGFAVYAAIYAWRTEREDRRRARNRKI